MEGSLAVLHQIDHQGIDHAPHGFVNQTAAIKLRVLGLGHLQMARKQADLFQLLKRDQARTQTVVHVVVVVGDLVGEVGDLRFKTRLLLEDEALAHIAKLTRIVQRAVFEDAFARFKT